MNQLVVLLLEEEGIPFVIEKDVPTLMKASKGKLNPNNPVGIRPKGSDDILFNIYQAVEWIQKNGLRRV